MSNKVCKSKDFDPESSFVPDPTRVKMKELLQRWFFSKKQGSVKGNGKRLLRANDRLYNSSFQYALIPAVTSLSPLTTILPLLAVLSVTAAKDAADDLRRHRSDNQVNNRPTLVIRDGKLVEEKWQNVMVGDVIKLISNDFVTADLFLLSTSENYGLCYIETAELDGETNLKTRQALPDSQILENKLNELSKFDGEIECEPPNQNLSSFNGKLTWNKETYAMDNDKMLLRGCVLRNTKWCFGVVIFAGRETKLMQNSGTTKFKRTSLDRFLNVLIIGIVVFLLSMVIICSVLCSVWEFTYGADFQSWMPWEGIVPTAHGDTGSIAFISFLNFFSYIILLNTVVPISLYVCVEVIRFTHSYMIGWDVHMHYDVTNTSASARTTTLNEELGQIQYIFSDKTGTLTQNIMTFNKCSINGIQYGDVLDPFGQSIEDTSKLPKVDFSSNKWFQSKFKFYDQNLKSDTDNGVPEVQMFWRLLALCHTVMPDFAKDGLEYQAQSPDEAALTNAARNFGFAFISRTPNSITIEEFGTEEVYELLCILDFNNVRKRMSVVVKDKKGAIHLLCKGADTMILERVDKSDVKLIQDTIVHLDKFASDGLRTLCLASKTINPTWYESWQRRHKEATIIVGDHKQTELDKLFEEIEANMSLLGATAIEDKLQDGVPEAIARLANANIKIWILTGDKEETAINIGYSCRLLTEDMQEIFIVNEHEESDVVDKLMTIKDTIRIKEHSPGVKLIKNKSPPDEEEESSSHVIFSSNQHFGSSGNLNEKERKLQGFALVINGHSLVHALKHEALLVDVACQCKAVICCRVTPLQKAMVVDLIKRHKKAVTLSIGDGANDVSMIKMAHIGVGISGQEGLQAVLAADYSIAQFRYLQRLLLVHGRYSYLRMSKFLRYFFYKNFAFTLAHFWYSFFCGYSAQTIYDEFLIACYNMVFTAMPPLSLGILDQDVDDYYSMKYPQLYVPGQFNLYFNMRIFVYSVVHGLVTSMVIFFIPFAALSDSVDSSGRDIADLDMLGFTVYSALVLVVTAQMAIDTSYWTYINHIFIWGSVLMYYICTLTLYDAMPYHWIRNTKYGVGLRAITNAQYWLCICLCTVILIVPVVALRFFWADTHPTLSNRLRVRQNYKNLRRNQSRAELLLPKHHANRRADTVRSGYAFSHTQGFGDLITRGLIFRALKRSQSSETLATPSKSKAKK